jgi:stage II sporulation protein GA (sporulation sigma-E factor processing peptidase)
MVIYLDLVMGLNFLVDLLLILGTNRLCGFPSGLVRTSTAAALGGVYAAGAFVSGFAFLGSTFWRLVFLVLMGIIAFGLNRSAWRRTGIFLLLSLAMGGVALGISREGIPALLLSAASVWLLSRIGFGGTVGGKEYIPITVTDGQRSISVIALKDTGNSLRDPISGEQVLVIAGDVAQRLTGLTPEELKNPLETMSRNPGMGLRLIPFHAVGSGSGMMLGMRFSDVQIGKERRGALVAFAAEGIGEAEVHQALVAACG